MSDVEMRLEALKAALSLELAGYGSEPFLKQAAEIYDFLKGTSDDGE